MTVTESQEFNCLMNLFLEYFNRVPAYVQYVFEIEKRTEETCYLASKLNFLKFQYLSEEKERTESHGYIFLEFIRQSKIKDFASLSKAFVGVFYSLFHLFLFWKQRGNGAAKVIKTSNQNFCYIFLNVCGTCLLDFYPVPLLDILKGIFYSGAQSDQYGLSSHILMTHF